jgi:hypothetical protein
MLSQHMTSSVSRLLALVVAVALGAQAFGSLRLTPQSDLYDGQVAPAMRGSNLRMTGAATPNGTVTAWMSDGAALHIALIDAAGVVRNHSITTIPYLYSSHLLSASDGMEVLVLVASGESYQPVRVSRDGTIAVGLRQTGMGNVAAMAWNGVAYIAYALTRTLELNRSGEVIAQAPLPYVYGFDVQARFFAAGRLVSILRSDDGTVFRATLTNEEGHVVAATWTPIPFTIGVSEKLMAASADQFGIHVVFHLATAPYTSMLQALGFNGAPVGDPIALDGLEGTYFETRISRTSEGSILVLQGVTRAAVVTKRRPRARDRDGADVDPGKPSVQTVQTSNSLSRGATLLPFSGGALIIAPLRVSNGYFSSGAMAAVTRIHADPSGISFSEPTVIEYGRPATWDAAATAHGDGFLVVWQQPGAGGGEIWLRKVDALGVPRDAARFIGRGFNPKIASQGDLAVVVWTSAWKVEAIRLGRDGAPLDPVPATVEFPVYSYPQVLHLSFDAMQFNAIVRVNNQVAAARVLPATPGSAEPLTISFNPDRISFDVQSGATASGNTILSANPFPWRDTVAALSLRHDLTPRGAARTVSILGGTTRTAWNGEHFVIAWWHRDHYRYARLSPSGEPLDSEFGRVLGEPVGPGLWSPQFEMLVRGEEFLIAVPGRFEGFRGQIALFRPGGPGKVVSLTPEATDIRALVRRPDDSTLLLTADRFGQLSVRMVLP